MHAVMHGSLSLKGAFTRATLPNQPVAGAFLTITNEGDEDDTLVAVQADFQEKSPRGDKFYFPQITNRKGRQ